MKKIIIYIIFLVIIPLKVNAISAASYVVIDQNSNRVLYGSNYNTSSLIASTTKVMTAIIVLENSNLDDVVVVGKEIFESYGSSIYLELGEEISVKDLLYGLMLRSGNDAAIVLANYVAGSMEDFAKLMNQKVNDLGLENTIFLNSSGLDEYTENKSTAYDLAVITSYAMKNDIYKKITKTLLYDTNTSYKNYTWANKNRLLTQYEYATGGKTGYTEKANRTLVTSASKDNMDIIVVTLNDGNDFNDHQSLYELTFKEYESIKVVDKDITSFKDENNSYYVKNDYFVLIKKGDIDNVEVKYTIYEKPVTSIAGLVSVYYYDELIWEDNIYIVEKEVNKFSLFWTKIVEWFKLW